MTKIVINEDYGGFGLSPLATIMYLELKGKKCYFYEMLEFGKTYDDCTYKKITADEATGKLFRHVILQDLDNIYVGRFPNNLIFTDHSIERDDPDLIKVVERLGVAANGRCAHLKIVEIPDDVEWEIDEYDGVERVDEKHRSWC